MADRLCTRCGRWFPLVGQARNAKRCPSCREDDRYGPIHKALRDQAAAGAAAGSACTRCGRVIEAGQAVSPDHRDGGGPTDYAGWAHSGCNVSAGVAYGNRLGPRRTGPSRLAWRLRRCLSPEAPTGRSLGGLLRGRPGCRWNGRPASAPGRRSTPRTSRCRASDAGGSPASAGRSRPAGQGRRPFVSRPQRTTLMLLG